MLANLMANLTGAGLLGIASEGTEGSKSFLDSLPDPMKPQLGAILFVIALLTLLFVFLKYVLFKPLTRVMDDREAAIRAGGSTKAEASAQIEQRQADYASQLRALRAQAFERRKALTAAAADEKQALVENARQQANAKRAAAVAELKAEQEAAKTQLLTQVELLSESMVQHLLKQA